MNDLYIVYSYHVGRDNPPKYIIGTYTSLDEAKQRLYSYGECPFFTLNTGALKSSDGYVNFINKVPIGDCMTELFTNTVNIDNE
tara:strand:+ start:10343 stop:10594 length:252 start_codon:yes stop_codon:yes gene_type:complete